MNELSEGKVEYTYRIEPDSRCGSVYVRGWVGACMWVRACVRVCVHVYVQLPSWTDLHARLQGLRVPTSTIRQEALCLT